MSKETDEFVVFKDDSGASAAPRVANIEHDSAPAWRVMIVDDDADVHSATEFALAGLQILDRPLEFLHAYTAAEAIELLMAEADVAVVLLDVVMESEEAGLSAISTIRTDLGLTHTQIILRTGQPGYAPELETIRRYDINDYRTKSELSRVKLYTALTASIRAYDHLSRLSQAREGIEAVMQACAEILAAATPNLAMQQLLRSALQLFTSTSSGFLCCETGDSRTLRILKSLGTFSANEGSDITTLNDEFGDVTTHRVTTALRERRTLFDKDAYTLYLPSKGGSPLVAYLSAPVQRGPGTRHLVEMFCTNAALCAENLALVERLEQLAFRDPLTGLASRRALVEKLNHRLTGSNRSDIAILLLDIDQFAETNDMFGHRCGDDLLKGIADRLSTAMPSDVCVSRLAADTFALLGTPAQLNSEEVRGLFTNPFRLQGEERIVSVSSSYVLAADVEPDTDGNDLLKDASIVIKRAKAQGLGRHVAYTKEFREETRSHSRTLHELGIAFRHNELFLVYQPQVALDSGRPIGVEALLRWRKADGTLIPPDRFIPIAENSGLIKPIGNWVLTQAVNDLKKLQALGFNGIRMAVNVSAKQLSTDGFLAHLDDTLQSSGIDPATLELEVTESVSILGYDEMHQCLSDFRARGVEVAIDDFGTGYSSLSYLDRLPANRLKIDRAFINAMTIGGTGPRIAEMVIPLGRQLGMKVLAEGVETEVQATLLREMGCHEAQGYLFARPMPFPDLLDWLARSEK